MPFLIAAPIDVGALLARVERPEHGGTAVFIGRVRNHHEGRGVTGLDYSAYPAMAEAEAARIVAEAEARWPAAIALEHRLGTLAIGEIAVAVVAASAHRDEAFAACRHVIEEVKRRVPIWKRETYGDGSVAWVDPTQVAGEGTRP